jgi:hypothetical protein
MASAKRKIEPQFYTLSSLAAHMKLDENQISGMVWNEQILRAAIPIAKLQGDFLKKSNLLAVDSDLDPESSKIRWMFLYRESDDVYEGLYVYIRHRRELPYQENELYWDPSRLNRKNTIRILLCPDSTPKNIEFYEMSDDVFCDFDGKPLYLVCNYYKHWSKPESYEASVEFCKSNLYYITAAELDRHISSLTYSRGTIKDGHLLNAIGLMAILLSKEIPNLKIGDRPNARKIADKVIELAEKLEISTVGLKAIHATITNGVEVFNGEEVNKVLDKK